MTDLPAITPLPTPPARGQDPAIFIQRADAIMDAIANVFVAQLNAFGPQLLAAIQERVTNQAAASYAGASNAANAAAASATAAQNSANSVNQANLLHIAGTETVTGLKTFAAGVRINNQTLANLSAAGVALAEAADAAAQRTAMSLGTSSTRDRASTAETLARNADKILAVNEIRNALAPIVIPFSATPSFDCQAGVNFEMTLTGNVSALSLANPIPGTTVTVRLQGADATARTVAFTSAFKGDLPALSDITSTKAYLLTIYIRAANDYNAASFRALG